MTDSAALLELAARVEAAERPDRNLDAMIHFTITGGVGCGMTQDAPAYTASLDAAMTLVGDWYWRVGRSTLYTGWAHLNRKHPDHCDREDEHSAQAATPALALCAAALRAQETERP